MTRTEEEREQLRRLVAESRRLSGVPRYVEDPAALDKIAALLLEPDQKRDKS